MSLAAVKFNRVEKKYGKSNVFSEVDFSIDAGCFFGVAGINGAGKTTMIKCLLDFCEPDSGSIEIFGTSARIAASRGRLAYLPERFTPPYYLTGRDFLNYSLKLQGRRPNQRAIRGVFDELDLEYSALDKPVRSFSKGMTQKLGLAACFLSEKELFVLDEPMSGLDPKARALVKMLLSKLRKMGKTLLFTSHSLADIQEICDQMAVLHRGKMQFIGTPEAFCDGEAGIERAFLKAVERAGEERS